VTVEQWTNYLAGTDPAAILAASAEILSGRGKKGTVPPLWDGHSAERIVDILLQELARPARGIAPRVDRKHNRCPATVYDPLP